MDAWKQPTPRSMAVRPVIQRMGQVSVVEPLWMTGSARSATIFGGMASRLTFGGAAHHGRRSIALFYESRFETHGRLDSRWSV
jgi:hypothetical protein